MLLSEREKSGRGAYLNRESADGTAMGYSESVGFCKAIERVQKIGMGEQQEETMKEYVEKHMPGY